MQINKPFFFSIIIALSVIFNLLNIFKLNTFQINSVFSFIYLMLVPGILLLSIIKLKLSEFWEYFVYCIGLSVTYLIIGGLIINSLLPPLGITKPLSFMPLLISLDFLTIILIFLSYLINKNIHFHIKLKKISYLQIIFAVLPFLFPIFSILGANLLNNNYANNLSLISLIGISIYLFFVSILKNKINSNIYPLSLYMISLSVLLMLSLRSWHILGTDIIQEFNLFQITKNSGYWSNNIKHAYNACLSITLLPTILNNFININSEYIFKLVIQFIYAFTPISVYLLTKKFIDKNYAFLGSILYISFPIFVEAMIMHIRQEIAFFFFSLMLLALFNNRSKKFKILSIIFGISLILSHYSSVYIAIFLITITYIFRNIIRGTFLLINKFNIKKEGIKFKYKIDSNISLIFILTMILATFSWYSIVNISTNNLLNYIYKFKNDFSRNLITKDEGRQFNQQFNILYEKKSLVSHFNNYLNNIENTKSGNNLYYTEEITSQYKPIIKGFYITKKNIDANLYKIIYLLMEIAKKTLKITFIIGIFYIAIYLYWKNDANRDYFLLLITSILTMTTFTIFPSLTLDYNMSRTFQQILSYSIYPIILGMMLISKFLNKNLKRYIFTLFVITYFLTYTYVIDFFIGGNPPITQLDIISNKYNTRILHSSEIGSLNWLKKNYNHVGKIYMDDISSSKRKYVNIANYFINTNNIPTAITKNSYVYLGYTNMQNNILYKIVNGNYIPYSYPYNFLEDNKNKIYSNGKSKIFK